MNIDTKHKFDPVLNWVDGEWVGSETIRESINPATYEIIGTYAEGGVETAKAAIVAAKRTMRETDWVHNRKLRAHVLDELADAFERNRDELIKILYTENGKIQRDATFEVDLCVPSLRYFAGIVRTEAGRVVDSKPGRIAMMVRQPMGVACVIAPWNSPVILMVRSLAPALAAGCAVIIKMPGKSAQITATISKKIFADVPELPRGVINVFTDETGDGAKHLVASPDVPVISFTGSTATGKAIALSAAPHFKRIGLELGGKTPSIVFDDADLDLALPMLQMALTKFAGQFCVTGQRVIVQEGIANEFRKRFAERLRAVKIGPATDLSSDMGPMIDRENVERVSKVVERAIAEGAEVLVRGGPITDGPLSKGAFFRPTFLEVTDPTMQVVQEEIFGPVVTMQRFTTEREAVAMANDSIYGLGASIWTQDISKALRVAPRIEAGLVWINEWGAVGEDTEEGGSKHSGLGRLNGVTAIDDFTEIRTITLNPGLMDA
ncbi:aldehyde dehydrogenase family protein [Pseudomonas fluorescens]|uniref:Betaine aldehyde dehydrogenase n=1 Tax=Pseudomonas fluorescens TaxID=294 RepID=A0A5E7Q4J2_PSEFL|nr:aldehyde dehydrogenase family protein [Pseudomonas fluorescens]VVP53993.1 Betaine aldehyde dehydrogenase [Pseudomonas fluorescens]